MRGAGAIANHILLLQPVAIGCGERDVDRVALAPELSRRGSTLPSEITIELARSRVADVVGDFLDALVGVVEEPACRHRSRAMQMVAEAGTGDAGQHASEIKPRHTDFCSD